MSHELLQFFKFVHLPPRLQVVSRPFSELAEAIDAKPSQTCEPDFESGVQSLHDAMVLQLPINCEFFEASHKLVAIIRSVRTGGMSKGAALRLLLEAKDCAVRAVLYKQPGEQS